MTTRSRLILAVACAVVALLAVTGCSATQGGSTVTVVIKDLQFNPKHITVAPGTVVKWINEDTTAHTSTSSDYSGDATSQPAGAWTSPVLDPGQSWSHRFSDSGDFSYGCSIHPYIKGSVKVMQR